MKFILFFTPFINTPFIKNKDVPVCKDCKFYKFSNFYDDYEGAKCGFFREKNIYNGEIFDKEIRTARAMCGLNATYFTPKNA